MKPTFSTFNIGKRLLFILLILLGGCSYFQYQIIQDRYSDFIIEKPNEKVFIVHTSTDIYQITDFHVDSLYLNGTLKTLKSRPKYVKGRTYRYESHESEILKEVHIFLTPNTVYYSGPVAIPLSYIAEVRVIKPDTASSAISNLTIVMVVIPLLIYIMIFIALN